MMGDFNRDIALMGRQQRNVKHNPTIQDQEWHAYTNSLTLNYIPTNTTHTNLGETNYTHTSLIDGFYIRQAEQHAYTSKTKLKYLQNSDHSLVSLYIPPNILISRKAPPSNNQERRLLNPIPQKSLDNFKVQ